MPYGIKNETKEQTEWMESCVSSVMSKDSGKTKSQAIAICKAQLKKSDWDPDAQSELSMWDELNELERKIREAINPEPMVEDSWISDVFDDYVIINRGSKLYKVDWSISGGNVNIDWSTAVEVERMTVYEQVKGESMKVPPMTSKPRSGRRLTMGPRTI